MVRQRGRGGCQVLFQIPCRNQEEIDCYWDKLTAGGDARAQQCGWLKDKYGLSWQVFPSALMDMLQMKKMDLEGLERAYAG